MKVIYLKFYDHSASPTSDWIKLSELDSTKVIMEIVGFIAKEDDEAYHLVMCHGDEEFTHAFTVIKKAVIKKKSFIIK
jgi:hypothetical protein